MPSVYFCEMSKSRSVVWLAIVVAGLGYFVDVFDLWLFANFRIASLKELGVPPEEITNTGIYLINCQQVGLLVGGFVWGIMGDKRGRISVMFGSIFLYSIANILNAYVSSVPEYALLRLLTGFGLAGEIGAGITLVSELLPKEKRGYGTTFVATLGVAGAIGAAYAGKHMEWRNAYLLGGCMGLALLLLRVAVHESGMFSQMKEQDGVKRGSLRLLFGSRDRVLRYLACILVGVPIYLVFGLVITFSPEIALSLGMGPGLSVPDAMLYGSIGITVGDLGTGLMSQWIKSRRLPIIFMLMIAFVLCTLLMFGYFTTFNAYYWTCGVLGVCIGYWACLITLSAEQFGTNLRATVTTTIPNLVRGSAILLNLAFVELKIYTTASHAVLVLTVISFVLALGAILYLKETYGRDLNFVER
jgi:MFS transporter, putative metabolite:H+ symporter